jgi:hypothetical protein
MNPCKSRDIRLYQELEGGDDGVFSALLMTELVARAGPIVSAGHRRQNSEWWPSP